MLAANTAIGFGPSFGIEEAQVAGYVAASAVVAPANPAVYQPALVCSNGARLCLRRKHLPEFTALVHAHEDIAATNKFPVNVDLGYCGPF